MMPTKNGRIDANTHTHTHTHVTHNTHKHVGVYLAKEQARFGVFCSLYIQSLWLPLSLFTEDTSSSVAICHKYLILQINSIYLFYSIFLSSTVRMNEHDIKY